MYFHIFRPLVLVQGALDLYYCRDRLRGARERHKKSIPLCVHLLPVLVGECFTQNTALVRKQGRKLVAQLAQQFYRAFDIREQEGDGAFGESGGSIRSYHIK
jgi:hypothetical protein